MKLLATQEFVEKLARSRPERASWKPVELVFFGTPWEFPAKFPEFLENWKTPGITFK